MIDRQAMAIVADDILFSINGKMNLTGIYTGHITIGPDPTQLAQLAFLFLLEGDINDPLRDVAVEVTLPGALAVRQAYPPMPSAPDHPGVQDAIRWFAKMPFVLGGPILRPGRIEAKIIHDGGEIAVAMPWIISAAALTVSSNAP